MYAIINYDTNQIVYIAHDKALLEEILMDIWEDDSYYDFCYDLDWHLRSSIRNKNEIIKIANNAFNNCFNYNFDYLDIIEVPKPID